MIQSINHVTYSVTDIKQSIAFYKDILKANILVESDKTAYFTLGGLWLALNEEKDIPRNEIQYSYTHMAFTIDESEFDEWYQWLKENNVNILEGRTRDVKEKKSIYVKNSTKILKEKFNIKTVINKHDVLYRKLIIK